MKALLLLSLLAAPLAAQTATHDDYVSPSTATLISVLVPGGGSMYAGRTGKGLAILGVGVGSFVAGSILATRTDACNVSLGLSRCSTSRQLTPLFVGTGAYLTAWVYGIMTARGDAEAHNANLRITAMPLQRGTGVGFALGF